MASRVWAAFGTWVMAIATVVIAITAVLTYQKAVEEFGTPEKSVTERTLEDESPPAATRRGSAYRLVCSNGCEEIDRAKADYCMQQARVAGRRGIERRGENVERAMAHWKACIAAEGYSLENCDLSEPKCTIPLDPFFDLW